MTDRTGLTVGLRREGSDKLTSDPLAYVVFGVRLDVVLMN